MVTSAPHLTRSLGVPGTLLLTLSAVTPASSVFVILPGALKLAGSGALLAMLAAMVVGIAMALVYAELSSAFPQTGGEYVFVGRTLGPLAGFTFVGLTVVGAVLSPAVLALGVGQYLAVLAPGLSPVALAIVIIASATVLGLLNVRANAWLTGSFLGVELIALAILAYLGFDHVERPLSELLMMINAVIVLMLSNARLLYSTGRDAAWGARMKRALCLIHPRFHSPWGATLIAGAVSILPCWLSLDVLLIFTGTSLVVIYGGICVAALAGRHSGTTQLAAYRMPLFPLAPVGGLLALAYVAYCNWIDPDIGRPSLLANVGVLIVAATYYVWMVRKNGEWVIRDASE